MNSMQFSGKNVEEAIANALRELNVTEDKITYEVIEEGTKGLLGLIGTKPAIIEVTMKPVERDLKVEATRFLAGIFENMDITAEMDAELEDNMLKIDIFRTKDGSCHRISRRKHLIHCSI